MKKYLNLDMQVMVEWNENLQSTQLYLWSHCKVRSIYSSFSEGLGRYKVQVVTMERLTCWILLHNLCIFIYPFHEVLNFKRQSFIHQGN